MRADGSAPRAQAGSATRCRCSPPPWAWHRRAPPAPSPCLARSMGMWCVWWTCRACPWSCAAARTSPTRLRLAASRRVRACQLLHGSAGCSRSVCACTDCIRVGHRRGRAPHRGGGGARLVRPAVGARECGEGAGAVAEGAAGEAGGARGVNGGGAAQAGLRGGEAQGACVARVSRGRAAARR